MFNSLRQMVDKFIGKTEEAALAEFEDVHEQVSGKNVEEQSPQTASKSEAPAKGREIKLSTMTQLKGILKKTIKLSEKDLDDILYEFQMDLLQNDVAMETSETIIESLKHKLLDREIEKDGLDAYLRATMKKALLDVLTPDSEIDLFEAIRSAEKPYKIMFFGVNGTGKTTTISKFARHLMDNGFSVVLAAGDTFRAGAIEQLQKHADNVGAKVIKHQKTSDSAAVIYDAVEHARARGVDVVLADTAGRMQTNANLMDEMKKIVRVNKPDLRVFVGDSLTGNDALEQAEKFNESVGIDAVILTKMDADAKGGSALSISHATKKPILFVGVGQGYSDLRKFDRAWFVGQIID